MTCSPALSFLPFGVLRALSIVGTVRAVSLSNDIEHSPTAIGYFALPFILLPSTVLSACRRGPGLTRQR